MFSKINKQTNNHANVKDIYEVNEASIELQ